MQLKTKEDAKWLPSENTASQESCQLENEVLNMAEISNGELRSYYAQPWEFFWLDKINEKGFPIDPRYRRLMLAVIDLAPMPSLVLDLGCGIGIHTINLARRFPNAQFVALDLSFRQLEKGRELARSAGLESRIHWICGDSEALPIRLRPDLILCAELIEHLLRPKEMLQGLLPLCTPGTRLIFSVPQIYGPTGSEGLFYKQLLPDFKSIETQDAASLHIGLSVYRYYHAQYTAEHLVELLEAAGFRIELIQPVLFKIPHSPKQGQETAFSTSMRRARNGAARAISHLILHQPINTLDKWMCKLGNGRWAENLIAVCRAQ